MKIIDSFRIVVVVVVVVAVVVLVRGDARAPSECAGIEVAVANDEADDAALHRDDVRTSGLT